MGLRQCQASFIGLDGRHTWTTIPSSTFSVPKPGLSPLKSSSPNVAPCSREDLARLLLTSLDVTLSAAMNTNRHASAGFAGIARNREVHSSTSWNIRLISCNGNSIYLYITTAYISHFRRFRSLYNSIREVVMRFFDGMPSGSLERREMQLILFACSAIIVLAGGLALFMYPARVFSNGFGTQSNDVHCLLWFLRSVHSSGGIPFGSSGDHWTPSATDRGRAQEGFRGSEAGQRRTLGSAAELQFVSGPVVDGVSAGCRGKAESVGPGHLDKSTPGSPLNQASACLFLVTLQKQSPGNCASKTPSTFWRTATLELFYLVSIGMAAQRISARLAEGLTDAAGVNNRFSFKVDSISYPEQASSAHDLELAVTDLLPENGLNQTMTREALTSR